MAETLRKCETSVKSVNQTKMRHRQREQASITLKLRVVWLLQQRQEIKRFKRRQKETFYPKCNFIPLSMDEFASTTAKIT